jgi:glycosyltransferase involved in cell wall biosynthesis
MWERYPLLQVFTQEDADEVVRLAPRMSGRVRVNPFGIAMPPPADVAQETEDTLLFLGNFTHPPNRDAAHWLVREIMPVVWRDRPAAHLLLVGSDPPEDVRALAAGQVDIFANVPDSAAYLERAAICLAPVRSGGGMRVKVLTALASGKAVVTTGRGAYGFIFNRQDPPMVIADDGPEIASGIVRVLGDAKLRRDLGRSGREIAERHHSPEAWAIRLEQVYAEAAAVRTPSSSGAPEL